MMVQVTNQHHSHRMPTTDARQRISSGTPFQVTIGFSRAIRCDTRVLVSGTGPVWPDGTCPDDSGVQAVGVSRSSKVLSPTPANLGNRMGLGRLRPLCLESRLDLALPTATSIFTATARQNSSVRGRER